MVATEDISSPIEQHKKEPWIEWWTTDKKYTPLFKKVHKTLLVLIQIFQINIIELTIV